MRRVLIAVTAASLLGLGLATSLQVDYLLAVFASNDTFVHVVRIALIVLLTGLLIVPPPRSIYFRIFVGLASALLTFGVAMMLEQGAMKLIDAVLFAEVALILGLESIEPKDMTNKFASVYTAKPHKATI